MRLSALRKLVEELVASPGGIRDFNYQATTPPAEPYDEMGTGGWVQPVDPSVENLIIVTLLVASNQGCAIDVGDGTDSGISVAYTDVNGTQILKAEVPPGQSYTVYCNGAASSIGDIREVPRSAGIIPPDDGGSSYTGAITYADDVVNGTALVIDDDGRSATDLGFGAETTRQGWIDDLSEAGGVQYLISPDSKSFALVRPDAPPHLDDNSIPWAQYVKGLFELNIPPRDIDLDADIYSDPWPPS